MEAEVAELRRRDAKSATEIMKYKAIIDRYKALLDAHNVDVPSNIEDIDMPTFMASVQVVGKAGEHQHLKAMLPSPSAEYAELASSA